MTSVAVEKEQTMSYQIYEKDDLFEMIRNFLNEYSVGELLEIVADAIEEREGE
jgi:hypothetical protein